MKKTKAGTRSKASKRVSRSRKGSRKPVALAGLREQITNMVKDEAVAMVQTTIEEAGKGHYAAMKYLFEMIGLYPATAQTETLGKDSLAKTLLRRMGLPEEPILENEVTKDCQADPVASAADAVE